MFITTTNKIDYSFFGDPKNEELLKSVVNYAKNPKKFNVIPHDIRLYLKELNEVLYTIPLENILNFASDGIVISNLKCNTKFYNEELNSSKLVDIMSSIDVDQLLSTVFVDDNMYNSLLNLLKKYKFSSWMHKYDELCVSADVVFDEQAVASLISNFSSVQKLMEESQTFNLTSIIDIANCLNSDSNIYSILLGEDNYSWIRRNPSPFQGDLTSKERLPIAINYLKKMRKRNYITVPPVDKNFELSSEKQINIVIGNTNDPINLTYGERTKSCMRIGGIAYLLLPKIHKTLTYVVIVAGVLTSLVPTVIVGVCKHPFMYCHSISSPVLQLVGIIIALFGVANIAFLESRSFESEDFTNEKHNV